jgi:hypothetical protein
LAIFAPLLLLISGPEAFAAPWGGKLPQGEISEAESAIPVKKDSFKPKSCFDDFGSAPYEKVFLDMNSHLFYYLDHGPPVDQLMDKMLPFDEKKTAESTKEITPPKFQFRRSVLYEVDLRKGTAKRLAYVELPESHQIMIAGRPPNMLYSLSFDGLGACGRGPGTLFGLNFKLAMHEREVRFKTGDFTAIRADDGATLFDNHWSQVFELAAGRFQLRRSLFPIPKQDFPVWVSTKSNTIHAWQAGEGSMSDPRGVKFYKKGAIVEAKVRFKPGDKIVLDGERAAVLTPDPKANQLTIMEIKRLTLVREPVSHSFLLPKQYQVMDAKVQPSFQSRVAVVSGMTEIVARQWKKAFIVDYKGGKILSTFEAADGFEIDLAQMGPRGLSVVIVETDKARALAARVHVYNVQKMQWKIIDLAQAKM